MITATLNNLSGDPETGKRIERWLAVLGTNTVPIVGPLPHRALLPGIGEQLVYRMDVKALTPEQRSRLIAHICERFGASAEEVERDIDDPEHGVPILASDVSVCLTGKHVGLLVP